MPCPLSTHSGRKRPIADIRPHLDTVEMSYIDQPDRLMSLGCVPAAVLGLLTGIPAIVTAMVGSCVVVPNCPSRSIDLLIVPIVLAAECFGITKITNRVFSALGRGRSGAARAVLTGLLLAACTTALNVIAFPLVMWW